jgi:D-2-hydroxyacid dehydrogenase (NADP+)
MTSVLIVLAYPERLRRRYYANMTAAFPGVTVNIVDHHSKAGPYLAAAEVLMTFGTMTSDELVRDAPRLKWIQSLGTGVDGIVDLPSLRPEVLVTNIRGIHGAAMSEAALMAMLALSRDLPRSVRAQDNHRWERWPARLIDGTTVGLLGVGAIAEALAPRCKALGMTVVGITRTPRPMPGFDRLHGRDELASVAGQLDFLVVLAPLSAETRHAVDRRVLAAMKPTACVVNLARGGVVDEQALLDALIHNRIAGAALDVFATEPLPADHPFWDLPNVIVTAHLGGFNERYVDDAMPTIEHNLRCFLAGHHDRMINVIAKKGPSP